MTIHCDVGRGDPVNVLSGTEEPEPLLDGVRAGLAFGQGRVFWRCEEVMEDIPQQQWKGRAHADKELDARRNEFAARELAFHQCAEEPLIGVCSSIVQRL